MVETEKVCNHKISTATPTSELHRTKSVGDNSSGINDGRSGGGSGGRKYEREDNAAFTRSNTIATGNKAHIGSSAAGGGEGGKGHRTTLERSMSAYYVFSSLPQVVHNVRPKTGYRNNVSRPRGAHDYFNVMWDPHIYRGTTTTITSSLKQPDATTDLNGSRDQQDRYRRRRAFLQGSQNTFNNSTNTNALTRVGGVGGGQATTIRSNRYRMTTKVTSRSRTFPPPEGRHQVHVQTEEYLEDLTGDVIRGPEVDAIVQTDPIEDEELLFSSLANTSSGDAATGKGKMLPVVAGVDASTQVLPGELITFDERVQPVVEVVVGKILEQSLLETMEEEEIGALKAQQNRFLEKRKEEERELKRLQEQQERISAEKERLKRHLELQLKQRQLQQNGESAGGEGAVEGENNDGLILVSDQTTVGGGGNNNNGMLSTAYLLELLPSVLNSLRQEGFLLEDQSGDEVLSSYVPLWQQSSTLSKPDDDDSASINNNNDDKMMTIEDGVNTDNNHSPLLDGCQSEMNNLEIAATENPEVDQPVEQQDSLVTATVVGEELENVRDDGENADLSCDPVPATSVDGEEEADEPVVEITTEDKEEPEKIEGINVGITDDDTMNKEEMVSLAGEEYEENDSAPISGEDTKDIELQTLGNNDDGESEAVVVESEDQDALDNLVVGEDPTDVENAVEDETGKAVDEDVALTKDSPDAQPQDSSLSSSHKLPNGAIPNAL